MRNYVYGRQFQSLIERQRTSAVKQKHAPTIIDAMNKGILNSEIILVAGEKGYAPGVEDLVREGFHVTVAFWSRAAKELGEAASSFFAFDKYVDIVGRQR